MTKILVIYYSRTGCTKTIAERMARACGADLEAIEDVSGRNNVIGYARSAVGAVLHLDTGIRPPHHDPAGYDLVLIGTPVWAWNVAGPVRTYVLANRQHFRRVALFCTYGSSGSAKVLHDLEGLIGRPAVAKFAITADEVANKMYNRKLVKFVTRIQHVSKFSAKADRTEPTFGDNLVGL